MATSDGVNSSQVDSQVEISRVTESVVFQHREPPPPYSIHDTITTQPSNPVNQQTVIIQPPLRNEPMVYNCTNCGERVVTKVEYESTKKTHMLAGFVFGFTLWCSLCCLAAIPYMAKTFKQARHYCPNCETLLGKYSKL